MNELNHVAIIMDGNGRWGLKKKKSRNFGHIKGIKSVETIVKSSLIKKIPYLTLYTFSTDNWKRPDSEINFLFDLIRKSLKKKINDYKENRKQKIDSVSKKKVEANTKLFEILNPILADYSKKNDISIILRKKDIVIAKSDLDITDKFKGKKN